MMARNFMAPSVRRLSTVRRPHSPASTFLARSRSPRRRARLPGAMSRIAVVTDTTQYLPADVIERHGIELVSLYVNWNGRNDRELDLPDYDGYYDFLRSAGELPSTSQPSLGDFLAVYEPLVETGAEILSIHLSGGISATVRAAEQARELLIERGMAPERMVVIDSRTGCAGH